jgi:transposase
MSLKSKEKIYKIDHMLVVCGHTIVPLPGYMCDLNSVELMWAKCREFAWKRQRKYEPSEFTITSSV